MSTTGLSSGSDLSLLLSKRQSMRFHRTHRGCVRIWQRRDGDSRSSSDHRICWPGIFTSASHAWTSLEFLDHNVRLAGFCAPCTAGARTHDCHRADPYDAGLHFRALQVPARIDLDRGVFCCCLHSAWRSQVRFFASIRMRTGAWNRRFHREPCPIVGVRCHLMLGGPIIAAQRSRASLHCMSS